MCGLSFLWIGLCTAVREDNKFINGLGNDGSLLSWGSYFSVARAAISRRDAPFESRWSPLSHRLRNGPTTLKGLGPGAHGNAFKFLQESKRKFKCVVVALVLALLEA